MRSVPAARREGARRHRAEDPRRLGLTDLVRAGRARRGAGRGPRRPRHRQGRHRRDAAAQRARVPHHRLRGGAPGRDPVHDLQQLLARADRPPDGQRGRPGHLHAEGLPAQGRGGEEGAARPRARDRGRRRGGRRHALDGRLRGRRAGRLRLRGRLARRRGRGQGHPDLHLRHHRPPEGRRVRAPHGDGAAARARRRRAAPERGRDLVPADGARGRPPHLPLHVTPLRGDDHRLPRHHPAARLHGRRAARLAVRAPPPVGEAAGGDRRDGRGPARRGAEGGAEAGDRGRARPRAGRGGRG